MSDRPHPTMPRDEPYRLYRVEVELSNVTMVYARSEDEARRRAEFDVLSMVEHWRDSVEVTGDNADRVLLANDGLREMIPWGDYDQVNDRTVQEILDGVGEEDEDEDKPKVCPLTMPLFP